ncbi:MAG: hypothetical protein NVS3B10_30550 [Polyangiales bacterium]
MKHHRAWPLLSSIVLVAAPSFAATSDYATLPGDTCESISLKFWGDAKAYDKLHALNPQLGPAPHHFKAGTIVHVVMAGPDAKVTFVRNHVEAATPAPHAAAKNEPLSKGNKVSTLDDSNAEVTFNDETRLQLGEHTLVVILGGTSAKASLGKTAEDTTLVKGTLSASLSSTASLA